MNFDETGRRIKSGQTSQKIETHSDERLYNLESEYQTINSENLEAFLEMIPKERITEAKLILKKLEESLK